MTLDSKTLSESPLCNSQRRVPRYYQDHKQIVDLLEPSIKKTLMHPKHKYIPLDLPAIENSVYDPRLISHLGCQLNYDYGPHREEHEC